MRFPLPELLRVERAGRALALAAEGQIDAVVSTSIGGAAALAACRHAANLGRTVRIFLLDLDAHAFDLFAMMLEVVGCMDLPLVRGVPRSFAETVIVGGEIDPDALRADRILVADERLCETHDDLWDGYAVAPRGRLNPFLRPARREEAITAEAARALDRAATEDYRLPSLCLMENAGIGATVLAAEMLRSACGNHATGSVVVLAGYGNNGGDAFVVARGLIERGDRVVVLLLADPDRLRGDAAANLRILEAHPGIVRPIPEDATALASLLQKSPLIVDGIFGTGLARPVEGIAAEAIRAVNASGRPVLALDLPSGLHADTGETMGECIRATQTVTFAAPKRGLFERDGPAMSGEIRVADIGCPR